MTSIEWVQDANGNKGKTWNPIVGCSKISAGCQNCYAINQAYRNAAIGKTKTNPGRLAYYDGLTEKRAGRVEWTGKVAFVPEALEIPLKTKKPTTWFLNSMSDLFHESVTDEQIAKIWDVMAATPHHTYQILTKRPGRMLTTLSRFAKHLDSWAITHNGDRPIPRGNGIIVGDAQAWPLPNVWLGVTVENQKAADERQAPLKALADKGWFTWVSHEPALEQVDFTGWEFIRWLVMGGESGPGARPFDIEWPRDVMAWASDNHVDFFLKQLGSKCYGLNHGYTGKGTNPDEWPEALRVRQMPSVEVKP